MMIEMTIASRIRVDCGPVPLTFRKVGGEGVARTGRIGLQVDGEDAGTVGDEPFRDRPPDPARHPGYDD